MFTGLIVEIGKVKNISRNSEGLLLRITAKRVLNEIKIDDSVAVNGVCQTVVAFDNDSVTFQAVHVSLEKTTLGLMKMGEEVNLELALRLADRLGGHFVAGHVNDIAKIVNLDNRGNNYLLTLEISEIAMKYIVTEGSITIDGVSLTVAYVEKTRNQFTVSIIPHTWSNTVFRNKNIGSKLNLEYDLLAKYVENLIFYDRKNKNNQLTEGWIRSKGF